MASALPGLSVRFKVFIELIKGYSKCGFKCFWHAHSISYVCAKVIQCFYLPVFHQIVNCHVEKEISWRRLGELNTLRLFKRFQRTDYLFCRGSNQLRNANRRKLARVYRRLI